MSYPTPRSANHELLLGMAEGGYKSVVKDRGGQVEQGTWYMRDDLDYTYYGIHEAPVWDSPDLRKFVPPYHTETPCPQLHDSHSTAGVDYLGR